jgi:hypothetical protein
MEEEMEELYIEGVATHEAASRRVVDFEVILGVSRRV